MSSNEQCRRLHRDDRRIARAAGQQRDLAKELPGSEIYRLRRQTDLDFARGDEIHAIAVLAAADDDGAGGIVARPQQARHVGDRRGADVVEERHLGDEIPGSQEVAPPRFLGKAGGEDAGPQRKDDECR